MREFSATPVEIVGSFLRNRSLIYACSKREVLGRYQGSAFGLLWSFFNPLFLLVVYTFVFSVVFKSRWGGSSGESKTEFALVLFAGLIVFNIFSECVSRSPALILANANYVKKVVFPLEILPWVNVIAALFHAAISLVVWLVAYLVLFGVPHAAVLYLPLIIFPLVLFIMGLSWFLASLGVYLRDVSQFIGVVMTVLMFLSPVFYSVEALPEAYRGILYMNPLTPAIEQTRAVLYWGRSPDLMQLLIYLLSSPIIAWLGFAWFQKTRRGFADVL